MSAGKLEGPVAEKFAHDLNNLLTVMRGFVEVLQMEITDDRHQEDLREVRRAIEEAIALTERVLPNHGPEQA